MLKNKSLAFFGLLPLIAASLGILYVFTSDSNINASAIPDVQTSNTPLNATAFASTTDISNKTITYVKEDGADLKIVIEVNNPSKFTGIVTDPSGIIHPMNAITIGNGRIQLSFDANDSDPSGPYTVQVQVTKTSATSDLSISSIQTNHQVSPVHLASQPPRK